MPHFGELGPNKIFFDCLTKILHLSGSFHNQVIDLRPIINNNIILSGTLTQGLVA